MMGDAQSLSELSPVEWAIIARQIAPGGMTSRWEYTIPDAEVGELRRSRDAGLVITAQQCVGTEVRLLGRLAQTRTRVTVHGVRG